MHKIFKRQNCPKIGATVSESMNQKTVAFKQQLETVFKYSEPEDSQSDENLLEDLEPNPPSNRLIKEETEQEEEDEPISTSFSRCIGSVEKKRYRERKELELEKQEFFSTGRKIQEQNERNQRDQKYAEFEKEYEKVFGEKLSEDIMKSSSGKKLKNAFAQHSLKKSPQSSEQKKNLKRLSAKFSLERGSLRSDLIGKNGTKTTDHSSFPKLDESGSKKKSLLLNPNAKNGQQNQRMELQGASLDSDLTNSQVDQRISSAKLRRSRVTMDINGLLNMLNEAEQADQKSAREAETRKSRITLDMKALTDMLDLDCKEDLQTSKRRRQTQRVPDSVIHEDLEEDDCTPMKPNGFKRFSEGSLVNKVRQEFRASFMDMVGSSEEKNSREVIKYYFEEIDQRIEREKSEIQRLNQLIGELTDSGSSFRKAMRVDGEESTKVQKDDLLFDNKQLTSDIDVEKYHFAKSELDKFETVLGVKIHSYEKNSSFNGLRYSNDENEDTKGFFAEFSIDSVLFRLKRLEGESLPMVKYVSLVEPKDNVLNHSMKFDQESRKVIFSHFVNRKVQVCRNLLHFMTQVVKFSNMLKEVEVSLLYLSMEHDLTNIEANPAVDKLSFNLSLVEQWSYSVSLDLIDILEPSCITVYDNKNKSFLEIPAAYRSVKGSGLSSLMNYLLQLSLDIPLTNIAERRLHQGFQ